MGRVVRGYPVQMLAGAGVCAALLCAPAAALGSPRVGTVRESVQVGAGEAAPATLRCPGKGLAAAAHATALSGGAIVRTSAPGRINSWTFTVAGDGAAGTARLALRCVRFVLPRGSKNVRSGMFTGRRDVNVRARSSRLVRGRCARGYLPTGYGLDRSGAGDAARRLQLAAAVPGARSWAFRLENTGSIRLTGTVWVRCVTARPSGTRRGRTIRQSLSISRPGFRDAVTGSRTLTHRCASGRASLAAGFSVAASDDATVQLAFPTGRRSGAWRASNPSAPAQRVRTHLTCLSLRTSFR